MEVLVYVANFLYLLSYFVKDMLQLRLLTVTAACVLVGYFYSLPENMTTVICWNMFFVALNVFQIVRILRGRRGSFAALDTFFGRKDEAATKPLYAVGSADGVR